MIKSYNTVIKSMIIRYMQFLYGIVNLGITRDSDTKVKLIRYFFGIAFWNNIIIYILVIK